MDNVRMPIKTVREGNKITKVCVEDYYKMINRIGQAEQRSSELWNKIWKDMDVEVIDDDGNVVEGCLIVGTGVSQPNIQDAFDEKIGNNIAFMKAKLNANMKKRRILEKLFDASMITIDAIIEELDKVNKLISMDLEGIRNYNPSYLAYLNSIGYEIQKKA